MSVPLCIWAGLVMLSMSTTLERMTLLSNSCSQPVLLKQQLLGEGNSSACQIAVVHSFGGRFFILNAINKPTLNYTQLSQNAHLLWGHLLPPLSPCSCWLYLQVLITKTFTLRRALPCSSVGTWLISDATQNPALSVVQQDVTIAATVSPLVAWPVKVKECCECWGAMSQLSHLTQSYLPHHLCMHTAAERQPCPSTTCPQRWLTRF